MKFKGFISNTTPTGTITNGSLWYQGTELPTTFPINVKTYNAETSQWSSTTNTYNPTTFDLWANLNNNNGYYWFGNEWNLIDENVLVDNKTIHKNLEKELELKDGNNIDGVTFLKLNYNLYTEEVVDNDESLPLNSAVYKELLDNTNSKFEYDDSDTEKDLFTITLKNNNRDIIFEKEIDFDDKLVFEKKEQTLENKTIDADDNEILNLTGENVKDAYMVHEIKASDTYYGFTFDDGNEVINVFTKTTAAGLTGVFSINNLTKEITLLGEGTIAGNSLTYDNVTYLRNETLDDYYIDKSDVKFSSVDMAIYLKKLIDEGKITFKQVSTFVGEEGDSDVLYYLNTTSADYNKGFYLYNGSTFVSIDPKSVQFVHTFTGVDGNTDMLYYLDTAYGDYVKGFYRYIETTTEGVTTGEFVLIGHNQVVYLSTFTGVTGNTEKLYYLDTAYEDYKKGFYRYDGTDFVNINSKHFFIVSTFTGVEGDDESLYYLDTAYDTYKVGFYRFIPASGGNPDMFVPIGRSLVKYVSTFNGEEGDTDVLYYLDTAYGDYKVGFYRYIEAQGVTPAKFMLIGSASEVFTDVDVLPQEDILDNTIYRLKVFKYFYEGKEIAQPVGYKSINTVCSISSDYIAVAGGDTYEWEDVDDTVRDYLISQNYLVEVSDFEEAEMFRLRYNKYVYFSLVDKLPRYELYHNPEMNPAQYLLIDDERVKKYTTTGLHAYTHDGITQDEMPVVTEIGVLDQQEEGHATDDNLATELAIRKAIDEVKPIIDVDALPSEDIVIKSFYRVEDYYHDNYDEGRDSNTITGYKIINTATITSSPEGLTFTPGDLVPWSDVDDYLIDGLPAGDVVTSEDDYNFVKLNTDIYSDKDNVVKIDGGLYHNPTGTSAGWTKIGSEEVEVITDVEVLPDSDIDTHSLYRITTDYYQDGNVDYAAIEAYQILSENVSADENALHWDAVDYAWENVTDSVVQELSTISDIQVTTSLIDADFVKLGTHLYDYIGNINVVKAGLYHNPTGLNTDWILVGGGTDVNLDEVTVEEVNNRIQANAVISVNALPTTNIKEKSLYEMTETVSWEEHHYTHNTDPVVEIKSYKLTPTGGQVLEITESDGIWFAQTQTWTPWNELTESTIDYYILINRLMECDFDDADKQFSGYKENAESAWKYDYKTKIANTPTTETFSMTKLFRRRNNQWKSISTIELTSEQYARLTNAQKNDGTVYILDTEESNAIIDVLELPTEDIETQSLYRLNDHAHKEEWHYYHNGVEMEDPPIHYYASNREDCVISENGILTPDSITLTYPTLTDTDIATMLNQSVPYIKEVDSLDDAELCCYGEDRYDWHSNFTEEHILIDFYMLKLFGRFNDTWKSHSTFKLTEQQYGALTNAQKNDGSVYIVDSNAEITLDEVTTEFVNNKLQANAAIPVDSLPTTDIKEKSLYEVTENVTISHETYTYDGNPITVIPKSYKSVSPNTTVGESSLDIYMSQWDTTTSYYYKITPGQYWVNPELVEGWISEGLIEEVEFTNNDSTAFCYYGDENFDNGSHFAKEGTSETFSMVKLFRRRNDAWQSISTIKLTDEVYNALTEVQKNDGTVYIVGENVAIVDVDTLPATNIASNVLYRLNIKECKRKPTGDVIENPVAYRSKNLEECSYNTDGMSFQPSGEEPTFYPWDNVEDTIISDLISGGYIEETSLEQGDFFKAASNFYLYKTSVEFTSYYELYHNPTATADAFIKVGGDVDVDNQTIVEVENKLRANAIIDIETLPTTNIFKNSIYRKYGEAYMYKGSEIAQPTGYVSTDTERVVITATGIDHMEEGTLLNHYDWENVTDSVIFTVGNLALATFEEAEMFKIGDNQYDYKTTVTHEQVCELYHNPTGLQNDYKLIGGDGNAEVDEVTTELVNDKVQANAIIPVISLPATNIKEKSLYQYTENVGYVLDHWTRGDEEIETPQHFYKSTSHYLQVYNGEILYYHEESGDPDWPYVNNHVEWYRFTDEHLEYFLNKNLIVECTPTDGTFCEYAAGKYDWVNDGTSATMGIKRTSETKGFSMTKLFRRVNDAWESISVIGLTEEQYNNLPTSIKNDGTLYIVDDAAELVVEKTYKALADKPVVNGITLNGSLTLEDLGLYSRTEVNALLERKGAIEFVSELPATPTTNTWYYSSKFEDGTAVPDDKKALYIVDEDVTQYHYMGIVGDIEMEIGDTLSGSEHLVTSSQVVKKEISTKLNKYGTQVNIETAIDDATLWSNLAQIGTDDKKTDSSMVFNAGTCYLIGSVSPTRTAQIYQFIVTGSAGASAINKKITLINPLTNEIFTKSMDSGTWQAWKGGKKYKHTLVRYNNDSFEYPMGWVSIISNKKTMTYNDFRDWLNTNGYTTATNSYYWCGGCCGTTGVRNKEDTGITYIGRVASGVFYDGTNMFFKYDYNGTVTILESRCKVYTEELN